MYNQHELDVFSRYVFPLSGRAPVEPIPIDPTFKPVRLGNVGALSYQIEGPPYTRTALIYYHGNGSEAKAEASFARSMSEKLGCSVFVPEYPGYGEAPDVATPESVSYYSVTQLIPLLCEAYARVVIMGYSVGVGPASELASRLRAKTKVDVKVLILINPFCSFEELSKSPEGWVHVLGTLRGEGFPVIEWTRQANVKTVCVHGGLDHVLSHSRRICAAVSDSRLIVLEGKDHGLDVRSDVWPHVEGIVCATLL